MPNHSSRFCATPLLPRVPLGEPHVDPGLVTLIPISQQPGLAVADPNADPNDKSRWQPVEALAHIAGISHDTVIVMVGETLELLTGGILPAGLHRVAQQGSII